MHWKQSKRLLHQSKKDRLTFFPTRSMNQIQKNVNNLINQERHISTRSSKHNIIYEARTQTRIPDTTLTRQHQ
jgi:hypothetical protein